MPSSDRFDQYTRDHPRFTRPEPGYMWDVPERLRPGRRAGGARGGVGGGGGGGGGDGGGDAEEPFESFNREGSDEFRHR